MLRTVLILCLTGGFFTTERSAMADVCEDYCDFLCRHYKQDLVPTSVRFRTDRINNRFPISRMYVHVKNRGDVALGPDGGSRTIRMIVSGVGVRYAQLPLPVEPGQTVIVPLGRVSNAHVEHCREVSVSIDTDRQVGQWGCSVYRNDTKELRMYESRRRPLCLQWPIN